MIAVVVLLVLISLLYYFYKKSGIKLRNVWIWLKELHHRGTLFRAFFITRNAFGSFHINSHINQSTGLPKVCYNHESSAKKSAEAMTKKRGEYFSYYKCLFCNGYHIGKPMNRKPVTEEVESNDKI